MRLLILFLIGIISSESYNITPPDSLFKSAQIGLKYGQDMYGLARLRLITIRYPESEVSKKALLTQVRYYKNKEDFVTASIYLEEFQSRFPEDTFAVKALDLAAWFQQKKVENYDEAIRIHQKIISEYPETKHAKESEVLIEFLKYKAMINSNILGSIIWKFQESVYKRSDKIGVSTQISEQIYYSLYRLLIFLIIIGLTYILYLSKKPNRKKRFWGRNDTAIPLFYLVIIILFLLFHLIKLETSHEISSNFTSLSYHFLIPALAFAIFAWGNKNTREYFCLDLSRIKKTFIVLFIGLFALLISQALLDFIYSKMGSGVVTNYQENFNLYIEQPITFYTFLTVGFLSPIWQEIIFRGVVYTSLREKVGVFYGIILCSLFFALIHPFTNITFFYFLGMGLIFTLIFQKTKSLSLTIIVHIFINIGSLLLYF